MLQVFSRVPLQQVLYVYYCNMRLLYFLYYNISECTSKIPKIALSLKSGKTPSPGKVSLSLNQVPHLHSNQINTYRIAFSPVHCCTCYTCRWFLMSVKKDLCRFLHVPAFSSTNHHQMISGHPSSNWHRNQQILKTIQRQVCYVPCITCRLLFLLNDLCA